ncbi:MAG: SpoIID/LytB domain-containing protein [Candidatus Dojkabacteria bacterium]
MKIRNIKTKVTIVGAFFAITIFAISPISFAQTSQEIADDIAAQQEQLTQSQNDLAQLQSTLKDYQATIDATTGELPKLQAELEQNESEIKAKTLELDVAKQGKKLKELERQQRQIDQQETLKTSYMDWRGNRLDLGQFINTEFDYKKIEQYSSSLTGAQQRNIFSIASDLKKLSTDIDSYDSKIKELEDLKVTLASKKKELEDRIAYYNGALASGSAEANSLGASIQNIQQNIDGLEAAQQAARQREDQILANPPPQVTPSIPVNGGFIFRSQGRDLYQGHGVGMSQWGAHGMGSRGYGYQDILRFYYTGVNVVGGYENSAVNVEGYGSINIEDYVAGEGEVPGRACGNQDQVNQNPAKYALDNGSGWSCWPEEAIKAQAVAFRTYGIYNAGFLHSDARSQVYNGTHYAQWAADETRGQVLTYGGSIIQALYSADNSQGNGTANNDTIFQNLQGDGAALPYLRSVNDTGLATATYYTYWQATTNQHNLDGVKSMILYNASTNYYDNSTKSYLNSIISDIGGSISSISFERDPSQRVKKVWFTGPNGGSRSLGGWWFKNLWNSWASDMGTYDYIYSQTFYLEVQ